MKLTNNDGRKGRDGDGDGILDESGKNKKKAIRKGNYVVLPGGFKIRRPVKKNMLKKGWKEKPAKKVKDAAPKDPKLIIPIKKKGVEFFKPTPKNFIPTKKGTYDSKAPKPGQAFDFKAAKIDKNKPRFRFEGKNNRILRGEVLRARKLDFESKNLVKAIKRAKRFKMKDIPKFNKQTKVDALVDNSKFLTRDIPWLNSLSHRELDILLVTHFKVEGDEDDRPRSTKGCFAKDGDTKHQVRKMRKMGIDCKECSAE